MIERKDEKDYLTKNIDAMFKAADVSKNGKMEFEEFFHFVKWMDFDFFNKEVLVKFFMSKGKIVKTYFVLRVQ